VAELSLRDVQTYGPQALLRRKRADIISDDPGES
jgi:hypothetical protein